jgi:hypothetical protein
VVRSKSPYYENWPAFEPIKILAVGVMPYGLHTVNFEKEFSEIQKCLSPLTGKYGSRFEVEPLREATIQSLKQKITSYKPHIVHLVTHGKGGKQYFETSEGQPILVSGSELLGALIAGKESLCLFMSTACMAMQESPDDNTWGLGKRLSGVVPVSIGMQIPISEEAAFTFTNDFYTSLAASYSILEAYTQARERMKNERVGSPEWIAPVLYRGIQEDPILFLDDEVLAFLISTKNNLEQKLQALHGPNALIVAKDKKVWKDIHLIVNQIQSHLIVGVNLNQVQMRPDQKSLILDLEGPTTELDGQISEIYTLLEEKSKNSEWIIKYDFNGKTSRTKAALRALRVQLEELVKLSKLS